MAPVLCPHCGAPAQAAILAWPDGAVAVGGLCLVPSCPVVMIVIPSFRDEPGPTPLRDGDERRAVCAVEQIIRDARRRSIGDW